jgi:hypothetical protein
MTKWFIDDERFPIGEDWVILRSSDDTIVEITKGPFPNFISFDHDLGGEDTAMKFINYLMEKTLEGEVTWPEKFDYYVHSQNPIGAANIRAKMDNLIWYVYGE